MRRSCTETVKANQLKLMGSPACTQLTSATPLPPVATLPCSVVPATIGGDHWARALCTSWKNRRGLMSETALLAKETADAASA